MRKTQNSSIRKGQRIFCFIILQLILKLQALKLIAVFYLTSNGLHLKCLMLALITLNTKVVGTYCDHKINKTRPQLGVSTPQVYT